MRWRVSRSKRWKIHFGAAFQKWSFEGEDLQTTVLEKQSDPSPAFDLDPTMGFGNERNESSQDTTITSRIAWKEELPYLVIPIGVSYQFRPRWSMGTALDFGMVLDMASEELDAVLTNGMVVADTQTKRTPHAMKMGIRAYALYQLHSRVGLQLGYQGQLTNFFEEEALKIPNHYLSLGVHVRIR